MNQYRCTKCNKILLETEFYNNKAAKRGKDTVCKKCRRIINVSAAAVETRRRYAARQRGEIVPLQNSGWRSKGR